MDEYMQFLHFTLLQSILKPAVVMAIMIWSTALKKKKNGSSVPDHDGNYSTIGQAQPTGLPIPIQNVSVGTED